MASFIQRILFGGTPAGSWWAELGTFALRVFAGASLAITHGFPNLPPSGGFISGVDAMGFPLPEASAWVAKLFELVGGTLLALGLCTRLGALMIIGTLGTAALHFHAKDPFAVKELAMMYLAVGVMFLLKGSGNWSLDKLIRGK